MVRASTWESGLLGSIFGPGLNLLYYPGQSPFPLLCTCPVEIMLPVSPMVHQGKVLSSPRYCLTTLPQGLGCACMCPGIVGIDVLGYGALS